MNGDVKLTPLQKQLARHALGLPNSANRSYRNRYASPVSGPTFEAWATMVIDGFARSYDRRIAMIHFELTPTGAEAALEGRETLDPEDFPAGLSALNQSQGK